MPTDSERGPRQSERVIKLEIATMFCDCVGDVMAKIKKKLSPFMPMTFMHIYFNERPILDPDASLESLVPSGLQGSCLFASIGMSSIDNEGNRNAVVHIEDPKFHVFRSKSNPSQKSPSAVGLPKSRIALSLETSTSPHSDSNLMIENALTSHQPNPSLMPGGIVNMVPDVLEEPSTSTSVPLRRTFTRGGRTSVAGDGNVLVRMQSSKSESLGLERPQMKANWKVANSRPSGDGNAQVSSLTRILGLPSQRRSVVMPSNNLAILTKKASLSQRTFGVTSSSAIGDRLKSNGMAQDSVTWVEDSHFQRMMEMNDIPRDPEQWNETHVQIWIRWASKHFGFNKQRSEVLHKVHGRNLVCDFPAQQILKMVECPPEVAKTFLAHLNLLREKRIVAVPQESAYNLNGPAAAITPCYRVVRGATTLSASRLVAAPVSVGNGHPASGRMRGYGRGHFGPIMSSASPVLSTLQQPFSSGGGGGGLNSSAGSTASSMCANAATQRRQFGATPEAGATCGLGAAANAGGSSGGQPQLWQFLLDLLTDWKYYNDIQWNTDDGEFKLLNPERVAKAWGERKNKPTMNYEKLSRALRYYYDGDMLAKVQGKKFVYKFVCNLKHLLGYEAKHLRQLVENCAMRHRDELARSRAAVMYPCATAAASLPPNTPLRLRTASEAVTDGVSSSHDSSNRFHPYGGPRMGLGANSVPNQLTLQMQRRQRLQVQRSINPSLFASEQTAAATSSSSGSFSETTGADASPFLAQSQSERWRGRGVEIWSPTELQDDDGRCGEDTEVTTVVESDEIKMPSLLMGPSVTSGVPTANGPPSAANISPMKLLGVPGSDAVMNAACDAELGQFLSGDFHNGEVVSVDVPDDMELDHFLSFEDKCLPTSPNRQMHPASSRLVATSRSAGNCVLGITSSSVNSLGPNGIGSNGHGICLAVPPVPGLCVSVSNENGLSPNQSTSNGSRVHQQQVLVTSADSEGDSLLHPFLDPSSNDAINIHNDSFEPWT